jgi:hypothetical protein
MRVVIMAQIQGMRSGIPCALLGVSISAPVRSPRESPGISLPLQLVDSASPF